MIEGVDYSTARPSPAAMYAAGKRFVMRYIGPGSDDKHLHPAERDALLSAGLSIALHAEGWERDALRGYSMGQAHANLVAADMAWLRVPDYVPVYFAVDFEVNAAQWPAVASYLRGAASVIGAARVGVYGSVRAIDWAARDGVAAWFCQTYAWSYDVWSDHAHVRQYQNHVTLAGGQVDLCRAMVPNFGQWPQPSGDDMYPGFEADFKALIWRVESMFNARPSVAGGELTGEINGLQAEIAMLATDMGQLKDLLAQGEIARLTAEVAAIKDLLAQGGPVPHSHTFSGTTQ